MTIGSRRMALTRRLRQIATGGTMSVAASFAANNLLRIVSSVTLTRLLDASAFGVVGIVMSVSLVLAMLSDVGTFPFIVRHQREDRAFHDEVWTLRVIRGAALAAIMFLGSWPIAAYLQKPQVQPVLAVYSLFFLLDGLSSLSFATAVRKQQLWRLSALEVGASILQLIVAVVSAFVWRNYWAMVVAVLTAQAAKTLFSYLMFDGERRRPSISRERASELWRFSRFIAASSVLTMLIMQSDKLVLARVLPLDVFGLYAIAVTLAASPGAIAHAYAQRILYPAYAVAAREDRAALRDTFYARRRSVELAYAFAVGGLIGSAPLLVRLLYDPRYLAVAPLLQMLAVSSLMTFNTQVSDQVLVAIGRTQATLQANVVRILWLGAGGIAGYLLRGPWGIVAVVGLVEAAAAGSYWWNLRRSGLLDLRREAPGLVAGLAGAAVGWTGWLAIQSVVSALHR